MQTKVALARVSIVDFHGKVLLDTFCKPKEVVVDYKTKYSGVTEEDLVDAPSVRKVQKYVAKLVKDKFIVGQSLENDLSVLNLQLPLERVRDTASYYRRFHPRGKFIGLRDLAKLNLGLEIQRGAHDSIIDARVAMLLYKQLRGIWERSMPIYEESDADTCFPVPFSFRKPFATLSPSSPLSTLIFPFRRSFRSIPKKPKQHYQRKVFLLLLPPTPPLPWSLCLPFLSSLQGPPRSPYQLS
ncbi:ribonuclease H-like domain-containing protein [Chytridium lagenaria]|nr:ribonuclease H-like domain-containing protein [Chytridium lagenaria]